MTDREIQRNILDNLVMKVETCLRQVAEDSITNIEGLQLIPKRDRIALCERAIADPSISMRIRLHTECWMEDVAARAEQLVKDAAAERFARMIKIEPGS